MRFPLAATLIAFGALSAVRPPCAEAENPMIPQPGPAVPMVNAQSPGHPAVVLPSVTEEVNARCLLRVVHALPQEGGIDAQLEPLKARLSRPPFLFWKTFHLVSAQEQELRPAGSAEYALPDGRKATLLYAEHALNARGRHVVRGSLHLDGGKSSSRTMFSLDEGGTFVVAGAKHKDGILIYALSCKTEK